MNEIKKIETITINPSHITIIEGDTFDSLNIEIVPEDADNQELEWRSDNPEVASVSPGLGCIYANSVGETKIYATSMDGSSFTASCNVTVIPRKYVEWIDFEEQTMTIGKGEAVKLNVTVGPEYAHDKSLKWSTAHPAVAEVDSEGIVIGKTTGSAVICACANDGSKVYAICMIHVRETTTKVAVKSPTNKARAMRLAVPVDVYSGAHKLNHTLLKLFGGQNLSFGRV